MATSRETTIHHHQDPFKSWKFLTQHLKINEIILYSLKTILAIFTLLSIFFVFFYVSSSTQTQQLTPTTIKVSPQQQEPRHPPTNVSHILFGIAGSARTWNNRRQYNDLWWVPNVTRGHVWLDRPPSTAWPDTSPPYRVSADTSSIKYTNPSGRRSAVRLARIVKESFELGSSGDDVRWFVMGDDDTVFFVENLVTVLGKYDHNQMYYIGGNSESVEQDVAHSYKTAFGGAGFAISYPLAKELVRILDACLDRYAAFYSSDQKISGCLSDIGVPITKELGFHQLDLIGNPYGLLAAHPLAPLVSLHHLDYLEPIFPGMTRADSIKRLTSSYKTDPGRSLQHSFCCDLTRNWSVSVSWGYTIQVYPSLVTAKELETAFLTFQTWGSRRREPFTFNTRFMSRDPCKRPVVFYLDRAESDGRDSVLTSYRRFEQDLRQDCNQSDYKPILALDSVFVTSSTLNPQFWHMAPRRQCCEVVDETRNNEDKLSVLNVKIRDCNPFETVSTL